MKGQFLRGLARLPGGRVGLSARLKDQPACGLVLRGRREHKSFVMWCVESTGHHVLKLKLMGRIEKEIIALIDSGMGQGDVDKRLNVSLYAVKLALAGRYRKRREW